MSKNKVIIGPDDTDIKNSENINVSEKNIEEIRGWIIDELNKIEQKIDSVITSYFKPEKNIEFRNIVLNTSIISTGSKMKILRNIDSFDNKIINKIQNILSIRNAFAHVPITKSAEIEFKMIKGNLVGKLVHVSTELNIMNSNGEIKTKNVKELIGDYKKTVKEINNYLDFAEKSIN